MRDWELHVHFKVHGSGTDLFGDGIAIWYAKDRLQLGKFLFDIQATLLNPDYTFLSKPDRLEGPGLFLYI